jgi:hypothetical protein
MKSTLIAVTVFLGVAIITPTANAGLPGSGASASPASCLYFHNGFPYAVASAILNECVMIYPHEEEGEILSTNVQLFPTYIRTEIELTPHVHDRNCVVTIDKTTGLPPPDGEA